MLSCDFKVFLSVLGTFSHKGVQPWYVWHEARHTTLFGIYSIVLKWLELKKSHMLEIAYLVMFLSFFYAFLALFRIKQFNNGLYGMKMGTQHYLV